MTNLQLLYSVLRETEDFDDIILDNFLNQDDNEYEINGTLYAILTLNDLKDIYSSDIDFKVDEVKRLLQNAGYGDIAEFIDWDDLIRDLSSDPIIDQLSGYLFIKQVNDLFIYEVEN